MEKKAIGGYFGLLEQSGGSAYYAKLLALNSGRCGFEHILLQRRIRKVHLPHFTCDVMLEPLKKHGIETVYYHINESLEPESIPEMQEGTAFLYTNYFGVKTRFCEKLASAIPNLILDYAQAFFAPPIAGTHTIYSPRKFFGVPDGAYVYTPDGDYPDYEPDHSVTRFDHLLLRLDYGAEAGYDTFKKNDQALVGQPIKRMSALTQSLMSLIDYEQAKGARNRNFRWLHECLGSSNGLQISPDEVDAPMVYPYRTKDKSLRSRLIKNNVFVATYWPNVLHAMKPEDLEYQLSEEIIPLPIDQRYLVDHMSMIATIINNAQ